AHSRMFQAKDALIGMACTRTWPTVQSALAHARSAPGSPWQRRPRGSTGRVGASSCTHLRLLDGSSVAIAHALPPDARFAIDDFIDGPALSGDRCDAEEEHG